MCETTVAIVFFEKLIIVNHKLLLNVLKCAMYGYPARLVVINRQEWKNVLRLKECVWKIANHVIVLQ